MASVLNFRPSREPRKKPCKTGLQGRKPRKNEEKMCGPPQITHEPKENRLPRVNQETEPRTCNRPRIQTEPPSPCSLGLSATSQQYFSLRTNQPSATSQQYFFLITNQHQPSATSRTNRLPKQLC
jgi:hypothetical protein